VAGATALVTNGRQGPAFGSTNTRAITKGYYQQSGTSLDASMGATTTRVPSNIKKSLTAVSLIKCPRASSSDVHQQGIERHVSDGISHVRNFEPKEGKHKTRDDAVSKIDGLSPSKMLRSRNISTQHSRLGNRGEVKKLRNISIRRSGSDVTNLHDKEMRMASIYGNTL